MVPNPVYRFTEGIGLLDIAAISVAQKLTSLHAEDYYKTQGLAFIMLVAALIHQEVEKATKEIDGKSLDDCLLDARMVKAHKRHGIWKLCNCLKKQVTLFMQLNTELKVI